MKASIKSLLQSKKLEFIMEAHNGISAKIVETTGFSGVWASGFGISASFGLRDCNEASWTQVLESISFMSDCTKIPILMDADTGFGNYNNFRRLVKQVEKIGISGVCLEDKVFPKKNSFDMNARHILSDIDEFVGKIKAGKDSQKDPNFSVVARTEGFIANLKTDEVLERAHAYANAGADALVIHSKEKTPHQIIDFMENWNIEIPIVIIPTSYHDTPSKLYEDIGISMVIWGNHNIRASVKSMQDISREIYEKNSIAAAHKKVVSMDKIFELTEMEELCKSDEKYYR